MAMLLFKIKHNCCLRLTGIPGQLRTHFWNLCCALPTSILFILFLDRFDVWNVWAECSRLDNCSQKLYLEPRPLAGEREIAICWRVNILYSILHSPVLQLEHKTQSTKQKLYHMLRGTHWSYLTWSSWRPAWRPLPWRWSSYLIEILDCTDK